jgi:hypothetical protein
LAQHFDAPDDYIGHFGWLCGYSADAAFLDDAAERFTRLTSSQRARKGRIALAIALDPGNPPVSLTDVPGVAHLPIKEYADKPFRLLHAKIALLGFRHLSDLGRWKIRLLISTGNWTRQTLEESLDLVWRIDIAAESVVNPDAEIRQECADIKAAWFLFEWIQQLFDTRLLSDDVNKHFSETANALRQVKQWIDACCITAQGRPRVFDNRSKSLLSQLPDQVKACSGVRRNYLAMGSGFYEAPADHGKPPEVPVKIIESLKENGLLTTSPDTDIYVNPEACQGMAIAVSALHERGITVRPASFPEALLGEGVRRTLHAKFLFSANHSEGSNNCASPWVYLASGNLTHPGLTQQMSAIAGNLEAGVVFAPDELFWEADGKKTEDNHVVTNLLPIHWDDEIDSAALLSTGLGWEQQDSIFAAPPVAWFTWNEVDGVCELRTDEYSADEIQVLNPSRTPCPRTSTGYQWSGEQPREVCVRWQADDQTCESMIPVIDQYGRIAATKLPAIDIEAAWWQLADFPLPPDDDDDDNGDDIWEGNGGVGKTRGLQIPVSSYPIRQMMELIESIAARQTGIGENDWVLWCNRLEQTLSQAGESEPVIYFSEKLKLNPLSPLWCEPFRPAFAETGNSELGKLYNDTLNRLEISWKVDGLAPLKEIR